MKTVPSVAAAGVLVLTLAACGGGSAGQGQNLVNGGTFTFVLTSDPGALDPDFTSLTNALQVDQFLYDSLVELDQNDAVVAGLAGHWSGTTTTASYTLRKGVTCADGTALTASQVAANITFVADPSHASTATGLFVQPGTTATADDAAGTVTVHSPTPDPFLTRDVGTLPIVCANGMAHRDQLKQGADGTGMFKLTQAVASDHYTLTRRHEYAWGPGAARADQQGLPDTVVIKVVPNETTAANLLLSGQVNGAVVQGQDQNRLRASKLGEHDVEAPLGELWFNEKAGMPSADPAVRKALVQALDLNQLGQVLTGGTGKPAEGLVAPGYGPCHTNTVAGNLPGHSVDAAKATLTAAGWTPGPDGVRAKDGNPLTVTFYYLSSGGPAVQAGAELAEQIWGGIGAKVGLKGVSDAEMGQFVIDGQATWTAALEPLGLTEPSQAVPFVSGPTPPSGSNFGFIHNGQYAADVARAEATAGSAGCPEWNAAEVALFRDVDLVPIVNDNLPTFERNATFQLSEGSLIPSSIRMLG